MVELVTGKKNCSGCTACQSVCHADSITMESDTEGFLYPRINANTCTECMACIKVCPLNKKECDTSDNFDLPLVFAVKHKNKAVLTESTSGGLFTAISDHILANNGYIVGAAYDKSFLVHHVTVNTIEGRNLLRGSKYVHSKKGDVFTEVKKLLDGGNIVYFTGLPCEIAGLNAHLDKKYNNLITSDLICSGVASPKIFSEYINFISDKYSRDTINTINLRSKEKGWNSAHISINLTHNKYLKDYFTDPFARLFCRNIILRPSCYVCKFSNLKRVSDITLADFWGIEKSHPEFFDRRGVSMALINTAKGMRIFENIKNKIDWMQSGVEACNQPRLLKPSNASPYRDAFWKDYNRYGYNFVQKKYIGCALKNRIKSQLLYPLFKHLDILKLFRK